MLTGKGRREARRTHWIDHLGRYSLIPEFMRPLLGGGIPRIAQGLWWYEQHQERQQRGPFLIVVDHSTRATHTLHPPPYIPPPCFQGNTLGSTGSSRAVRGAGGRGRGGALLTWQLEGEDEDGMNFPNQTRATLDAQEWEDPCRPGAISAILRQGPCFFSGPVNALWVRYLFFLSFTDSQVCEPLRQSLSLFDARVILHEEGESGGGDSEAYWSLDRTDCVVTSSTLIAYYPCARDEPV